MHYIGVHSNGLSYFMGSFPDDPDDAGLANFIDPTNWPIYGFNLIIKSPFDIDHFFSTVWQRNY